MNNCLKNLYLYCGRVSHHKNIYIRSRIFHRCISDNGSADSIEMSFNKYDDFSAESSSSKPPLIIMHGLFGSKNNWQSISKALNKSIERTIYTVDARNHGNSPHTENFSYDLLGNDIKQMLNNLSLNKVCLMGHSMGGRAFMYFALKYPEYLEKLIVVDISPFSSNRDMSTMLNFFQIMKSVQIDPSISTAEGRRIASEQLSKQIHSKMIVDFLLTNLIKSTDGTFRWKINLDSLERNFKNSVMNFPDTNEIFDKPTLFIAGSKSDYLTRDQEDKIVSIFPKSKFVYLNTGHWVHAEDPAGLISNVVDFLKL